MRVRERGSAALELPFVLGLIVIPFALLVLQLPVWVERQAAATDAASEVARAIVVGGGAVDPAALLSAIEASHDLSPGALQASVLGGSEPGAAVVVRVTVELPTLSLPVFGVIGQQSWTTSHTERRPDFGSTEP